MSNGQLKLQKKIRKVSSEKVFDSNFDESGERKEKKTGKYKYKYKVKVKVNEKRGGGRLGWRVFVIKSINFIWEIESQKKFVFDCIYCVVMGHFDMYKEIKELFCAMLVCLRVGSSCLSWIQL